MKKKLIAETAWHHQGDESFMLELVDALCQSMTDCVKVHLLMDIDEYMHPDHPMYETLKEWMLTEKCWEKVVQKVTGAGKELLVLCNDRKSIDFAITHDAAGLELHAVAVHDPHLVNHLALKTASTDKQVFVGVGAIPLEEIDGLYHGNDFNLVLMFGIQNYPTHPGHVALARQRRLMGLYPAARYGYADHTKWNHPDNMMISLLGALDKAYLEKHATTRPGEKRVDFEAAISIEQLNQLKARLDMGEQLEGDGRLLKNEGEIQYGGIGPMRKGMIAVLDFRAGDLLDMEGISFQRTAQTSDLLPIMLGDAVGRYQFKADVRAGSIIHRGMLELKK